VTGLRAGIHPDYIRSFYKDVAINDEETATYETFAITGEPIHIVSVTASLACVTRNESAGEGETSESAQKKQLREAGVDTQGGAPAGSFIGMGTVWMKTGTPIMFSLLSGLGPKSLASGTVAQVKGGWNAHENTQDERDYICTGSLTSFSPSWQSPPDLFGYFADGGIHLEINSPDPDYGIRVVVNYIDRKAFSPAYGDPIAVLQHYWACAHIVDEEEFLGGFYGGTSVNISSESTATYLSTGGAPEGQPLFTD